MMKRICMLMAVASATCGWLAPSFAGETLNSVEKKVAANWAKHRSLVAAVTMFEQGKIGDKPRTVESTGQFELLKKDGKTLTRLQLKIRISFGEGKALRRMSETSLAVDDGAFLYTLFEGSGRKIANKKNRTDSDLAGGSAIFAAFRDQGYELKLLAPKKIGDRDVYVIQATPKAQDTNPKKTEGKTLVYIDQDTGFIIKRTTRDTAGKPIATSELSELQFDAEITPDRFVFEAPANTSIRDHTGG